MKVPAPCDPFLEPYTRQWGATEYTFEPTPRDAVDRYFAANLDRAIRLTLMMCHWTGPPLDYRWGDPLHHQWGRAPKFKLRTPPMPYGTNSPYYAGAGCPLCGCETYALGWHEPWGPKPGRASWHACCALVWRFMTKPSAYIVTDPDHEADHIVPLWRAFRDHRDDPWPLPLRWWLPGNLQSIPSSQHVEKTRRENRSMRAAVSCVS